MRKIRLISLCLFLALTAPAAFPQSSPVPPAKAASSHAPSAAEIAAARAARQVWVNLNTGIYHKGGRWYGKTKDGKFMTEAEARKAGYKPSKRD
jgi:hypothetical protein